ncbi:hypothetical protein FB451DRAFT_1484062 [Mycena latifolia]|nr:hypothetical protein FB451DRAFT_1484062 [Mycena latifolia]
MTSPFAPKLGTNYCPEDGEIAEIIDLLVEPTHQLERLDGEIADMQNAIDKLKQQRESLVAYVEGHKALISPVRRLPLDIIQEIFMACLPTHRNCVMSASEAPVLLGRICSSWRAISLSTPRLWARLHIVEPQRSWDSDSSAFKEKVAQRLETTKTWLGRSGRCPLSISLETGLDRAATPNPSRSDLFLQPLIPFAPRWQHIQFTIPSFVLPSILHLVEGDVPMLKNITLHQGSHNSGEPIEWKLLRVLSGPQVSSITMTGSSFILPELPLRWNALTALSILHPHADNTRIDPTISSDAALQIIARCPELWSCKLRLFDGLVQDPAAEMADPRLIVQHSLLQSFEICCEGKAALTFKHLLGRLSLPQLRDFTLGCFSRNFGGHTENDDATPPLARFLAASTHLESLALHTGTFSKPSLVEIFRSLPEAVQQLYIEDITKNYHGAWGIPLAEESSLDDDVLALLTPAPSVTACCPALQEIHIDNSRSISDAALLRFITSRTVDGLHQLRRVTVQFAREMHDDILPNVQQSIATGLDVWITHSPRHRIAHEFSPWQGLVDVNVSSIHQCANASTGTLTVSFTTATTPGMNSLQALPPEVWAYICGEMDERRHLVLLGRTSRLFRDQAQRILYYRVDLEECSMRGVKSWCLAVTRHSILAERVHALALLLPGNMEPSDATKIERALTRCVNLKELKLSGEVYASGHRVSSLNGWMINDCPFRLTKFSNSYFNFEWIKEFWGVQSNIRVLSIPFGSFPCSDGQLPNLIAVKVPYVHGLPPHRPLQRIETGFQRDYSALAQYSKTLTTLNVLRQWVEEITLLENLTSIVDLLPALVHLGIVEVKKEPRHSIVGSAPTLILQRFRRLETFIFQVRNVARFNDRDANCIYHMDEAADVEALGLAIMVACPRLRWTVLGAEVQLDKELTCTLRRSADGRIHPEAGTDFNFEAHSMFWKPS